METATQKIMTGIFVTVVGGLILAALTRGCDADPQPSRSPLTTVSGNWVNEATGVKYDIVATGTVVTLAVFSPVYPQGAAFQGQGHFDGMKISVTGFSNITMREEQFIGEVTNNETTELIGHWFDVVSGRPIADTDAQVRLVKAK
ncbi:MAG: hypothetical protein AAGG48_01520 [Planctomycetota bacterium]